MEDRGFVKGAVIRNHKDFFRIDGKMFKKGNLFRIIFTNDYCSTFVCQSLENPREKVRIPHNSKSLRHFEITDFN